MRRATRILFSLVNLGHLQAGQSGAGPWPAGGLSGRLAAPPSKAAGGLRARRSARRCPTMSFEVSDIKAEPWLVGGIFHAADSSEKLLSPSRARSGPCVSRGGQRNLR